MIVVRLKGGLGNQMFQYAIGRALSLHHKTSLYLDLSEINDKNQLHTFRKYELKTFNIKAILSNNDFSSYRSRSIGFLVNLLNPFLKKKILKRIVEKQFHYDPALNFSSDNLYLIGYWNSPIYFERYTDIIKKDFSFKINFDENKIAIAEKIKKTCSVSIHIRRGDYITNSETNAYHGICDIDYYKKAVNIILEKNKNAEFFIFTDDPKWVNENFKMNARFSVISDINNSNGIEDMYLMTLCKHAIIANSTFSWWAAWLINNKDKIVIAPLQWYNGNSTDTKNLFPNSWIRI